MFDAGLDARKRRRKWGARWGRSGRIAGESGQKGGCEGVGKRFMRGRSSGGKLMRRGCGRWEVVRKVGGKNLWLLR